NGRSFEDYFPTVPLQNVATTASNGKGRECLRSFNQRQRRWRDRTGWRGPTRHCAHPSSGGWQFARRVEDRGSAPPGPAYERAKKIRTGRGAEAFPVLEALIGHTWRV